jgi:transcriptional regulator with XRE-family HTH domain
MDRQKEILAENLTRLMNESRDLRTIKQLSEASKVSTGTIDRIRRAESAAGVDTVGMLAEAFGLTAWQMLVPDLHPTNPPMLAAESERLKQLYANLKHTAEAIEGHLRGDGNTTPGAL